MKINENTGSLGVTFDQQGNAQILLWAPLALSVELTIQGHEAPLALVQVDREYWYLKTPTLKPGDRYWFRLDGAPLLPDPASRSQPDGVHGPSQALRLDDFPWTDMKWTNKPLSEYIIYEVHVGAFSSQGNFDGLLERLDYLKALGITAIELMPVAQFPGRRNWGYDGVFPFAVQNSYGGAQRLQALVNACHCKGLAVILDVVYNHLGPEGNYLPQYAPYFTDKYRTPWGKAVNYDDAYCDGVRRYFLENARMWFEHFHFDALRLDAVHAIVDFSPNHIMRELLQQTDALMEATGRCHYLIAELDLNDPRYTDTLADGGYGLDTQWVDEFHHALRVASGQEKMGYYSDFNGLEHLAKAYRDAYVYDGAYSEHRKKNFGRKVSTAKGERFVVFSQNHDQVGNRMLGERTSKLLSPGMQRVLAGAVLLAPFIPLLFMGEEYAEPNPFQYFIDHGDVELVKAVREGRAREFKDFYGERPPDPFAVETFMNSKLEWELLSRPKHKKMLAYYQQLIRLRKHHEALRHLDGPSCSVELHAPVLVVIRRYQNQVVIGILNFSNQLVPISLPHHSGNWHKLIASCDNAWGGTDEGPEVLSNRLEWTVPAESFSLYTNYYEQS
ncbi:maltooligosyltrehalose trehalohydrolase [Dyadobacter jejuensis]|uniref:Malto-oligosyltrehalose trehalohydrolase n=1 Tax=Dyadobacter jejuensis TaxID=1082580 RepID=A0A316AN73_9BACT|nr:malto-oligosyltrehalose trehalohydrolase [Dyadobacter jejuensis]PWJ59173.1 maltooligosyltrehalose trehalohydrolase [Dyadobacter jejuensis]